MIRIPSPQVIVDIKVCSTMNYYSTFVLHSDAFRLFICKKNKFKLLESCSFCIPIIGFGVY